MSGNGKAVATRDTTLKSLLKQAEARIADVAPKHMDAARFIRLANLAINKVPKLQQADQLSIISAVMDAARLGLEIGRECHLVPFYDSKSKKTMCQLIPDYKGIIKLMVNAGVKSVDARVVREGDLFEVQYGSTPYIQHEPKLGSQEPRKVVAYYSVAHMGRDVPPKVEVMEPWEVDAIRNRSKAKDHGPWKTDPEEMGKKTVVKRMGKQIPQSPEVAEILEMDNRFESGRVGSFLPQDTPKAIAAGATEATEEAAEDLRARLEEQAET